MADLRAVNQEENYSKIAQVLDRLSRNWDQREGKYKVFIYHLCDIILTPFIVTFSYASLHRRDRKPLQRTGDEEEGRHQEDRRRIKRQAHSPRKDIWSKEYGFDHAFNRYRKNHTLQKVSKKMRQ